MDIDKLIAIRAPVRALALRVAEAESKLSAAAAEREAIPPEVDRLHRKAIGLKVTAEIDGGSVEAGRIQSIRADIDRHRDRLETLDAVIPSLQSTLAALRVELRTARRRAEAAAAEWIDGETDRRIEEDRAAFAERKESVINTLVLHGLRTVLAPKIKQGGRRSGEDHVSNFLASVPARFRPEWAKPAALKEEAKAIVAELAAALDVLPPDHQESPLTRTMRATRQLSLPLDAEAARMIGRDRRDIGAGEIFEASAADARRLLKSGAAVLYGSPAERRAAASDAVRRFAIRTDGRGLPDLGAVRAYAETNWGEDIALPAVDRLFAAVREPEPRRAGLGGGPALRGPGPW